MASAADKPGTAGLHLTLKSGNFVRQHLEQVHNAVAQPRQHRQTQFSRPGSAQSRQQRQGEQCYLQAAGSDDAAAAAKLSIVTPNFDARAIPAQSPFKVHSPHSLLHTSGRSRPHTPGASLGHPDFTLCSHGRLPVLPGRTEPVAQHWHSSSSRGSTPRSDAGQSGPARFSTAAGSRASKPGDRPIRPRSAGTLQPGLEGVGQDRSRTAAGTALLSTPLHLSRMLLLQQGSSTGYWASRRAEQGEQSGVHSQDKRHQGSASSPNVGSGFRSDAIALEVSMQERLHNLQAQAGTRPLEQQQRARLQMAQDLLQSLCSVNSLSSHSAILSFIKDEFDAARRQGRNTESLLMDTSFEMAKVKRDNVLLMQQARNAGEDTSNAQLTVVLLRQERDSLLQRLARMEDKVIASEGIFPVRETEETAIQSASETFGSDPGLISDVQPSE